METTHTHTHTHTIHTHNTHTHTHTHTQYTHTQRTHTQISELTSFLAITSVNNVAVGQCFSIMACRLTVKAARYYWYAGKHQHEAVFEVPVVGMLWFMSDINQPSLPTPLYSVLVFISVYVALSTVFHTINSPDNSPLSHSVLPVLFLPYWSFQL